MRDKAKPIKAKPSFYAICFEGIKSIGMRYGYNIVLHGSLDRDLDLIAVPWIDETGSCYPEGGSGELQKMELCQKCAVELVSFLRENGYRVVDSDWDY